uniref:Probable basic-leucine zipper transcription factor F n=1 Tax=Dermatophagoides pteronyssinus TaxID=6956 RepID=A0A6P6Y0D2_DERPT|nr:probable basic-leucine zipper transcription factor F [Dermatophagoides pteronyssinus]
MYGVLKFFEKYQHRRRNVQEQNNDFVDNEKKHTIERDRKRSCQKLQQQQSKRKSPFTKLFRNVLLKLSFTSNNHKNEYFPSEQEKRCGIAIRTGYQQQQQQQQNVSPNVYISGHDRDSQNLAHANISPESSKVDLSSLASNNHGEDQPSMVNGGIKSRSHQHPRYQRNNSSSRSLLQLENGGSLTRVVITEIEHHQFQRNKEIEESNRQQQQHLEQPENMRIANNKLNAAFDYLENETYSDPIYDVPSSRSLINLIDVTKVNLPIKQQRGQNNNNEIIAYYHTSTPNLFSIKSGVNIHSNGNDVHGDYHDDDDDEESIYDTPKSRSFVA